MDPAAREKRIQGLESIQKKALNLASEGLDAFQVRDFITESKKGLAYTFPEEEQYQKAKTTAMEYKRQQATDPIMD
jgi:hypothetical protein